MAFPRNVVRPGKEALIACTAGIAALVRARCVAVTAWWAGAWARVSAAPDRAETAAVPPHAAAINSGTNASPSRPRASDVR